MPQLLAGLVVGRDVTEAANPLNASGATPPDTEFVVYQVSLHQVSEVVGVAAETDRSPRTNAPLVGNAKTITFADAEEARSTCRR